MRDGRMDAGRRMKFEDIWAPGGPLPGKATLAAMADLLGETWDFPHLGRRVKIVYNPRLRSALGRALLGREAGHCRIELNTRLLLEHPGELLSTLAHELAHVVVHLRYGLTASAAGRRAAPHGPHFRTLMRAANLSEATTHDLPTDHLRHRRRQYLYLHRCSDCGYSFIARKPRRGYYCRTCGPEMTWDIFRVPNSAQGLSALRTVLNEKS